MKTGILLVAFGTSEPGAGQALDHIDQAAARRFPGVERRWAYTSKTIRRKLAAQGTLVDSPREALDRFRQDGFSRVAVQSLHAVAGIEYEELRETLREGQREAAPFDRLELGAPLLATVKDLRLAVGALLAALPAERKPEQAVILMGHGTTGHPAELAYVAAASAFHEADSRVWLAAVEGEPALAPVVRQVKALGERCVWLVPFMSVAGNHVRHDMCGEDDESWVSILKREGLDPRPVLKGMAEYDGVVSIWMDHLSVAMEKM